MPLNRLKVVVFSKLCRTLGWLSVERMRDANNETPTDILYVYF